MDITEFQSHLTCVESISKFSKAPTISGVSANVFSKKPLACASFFRRSAIVKLTSANNKVRSCNLFKTISTKFSTLKLHNLFTLRESD